MANGPMAVSDATSSDSRLIDGIGGWERRLPVRGS
jgi:hypothetical protein